jgi:hypothetical protein
MLIEEHFHLVLIDIAHGLGRYGDLITILVVPVFGDGIDCGEFGAVVVEDAEFCEVRGVNFPARVMRQTLVALDREMSDGINLESGEGLVYLLVIKPVCLHCRSLVLFGVSRRGRKLGEGR